MGKKKKNKGDQYCERKFEDEKVLVAHQKAKHFKCHVCHKKLTTAGGMVVHVFQVHKENIQKVPNAKPGRDSVKYEIYGMEGIPDEDGDDENPAKKQRIEQPIPAGMSNSSLLPTPLYGQPAMFNPTGQFPPQQFTYQGMQTNPWAPGAAPPGMIPPPQYPPNVPPSHSSSIPSPPLPVGGNGSNNPGAPPPGRGAPPPLFPIQNSPTPPGYLSPPAGGPPTGAFPAYANPPPHTQQSTSPPPHQHPSLPPHPSHPPHPSLPLHPSHPHHPHSYPLPSQPPPPYGQQLQPPPLGDAFLVYDDETMSVEEKRAEMARYRYDEEVLKQQMNKIDQSIEFRVSQMIGNRVGV